MIEGAHHPFAAASRAGRWLLALAVGLAVAVAVGLAVGLAVAVAEAVWFGCWLWCCLCLCHRPRRGANSRVGRKCIFSPAGDLGQLPFGEAISNGEIAFSGGESHGSSKTRREQAIFGRDGSLGAQELRSLRTVAIVTRPLSLWLWAGASIGARYWEAMARSGGMEGGRDEGMEGRRDEGAKGGRDGPSFGQRFWNSAEARPLVTF
jgi:hypothetical protein